MLNTSGALGIWTWPIVVVGQIFVALVFGLLAARIPLAGYSYQWMSRLGNPSIGWAIGWLSLTFLIVDVVAVDYALASTVLPALFSYSSGEYTSWVVTGVIVALQCGLIMTSTMWTTRINNAAVGTEVGGILGLVLLLFVVAAARGGLHWGHLFSKGAAAGPGYFGFGRAFHDSPWLLAFLLGSFTIVGFEAAANLAEETDDPRRTVPRAMWTSVVVSGIVGFLFLIAITVAGHDLTALAKSSTPVADVATQVLGSVIGKLFLIVVTFSIFACGLVIFVTLARLTWAMSRDERLPGWRLWRQASVRFRTPLNAALLAGVCIEVVLAVFATQTGALFKLFSAATLLPALIYLATVLLHAFTRRQSSSEGGFSLGRFEWPVVILALLWLLFELSIFRDASFKDPWIYVGVMLGIGMLYFAWMRLTGRSLEMPTDPRDLPELEET